MKKWKYRLLTAFFLGVFVFCGYEAWTIYNQNNQVENETKKIQKENVVIENSNGIQYLRPDWNALKAINKDIIAWIYVPDCAISYPVVQGSDNAYYLDHTIYKGYNNQGTAFLDCNANADFEEDNSVIYGHSVKGGGMFTLLKNFTSKSFFDSHKAFYLLTPNGNYKCKVFAFSKSTNESIFYQSNLGEDDARQDVIEKMKQECLYYNEINTDNNMVTLSTCNLDYGLHSNQRFLLTGVMHPYFKDIVYK